MDFDGDGRMDLLSGSIGGKVHLFKRKPNGTFAAGVTLKRNASGLSLGRDLQSGSGSTVCTADWFDSGKLDLFVGNGEGAIFLARNEGTRKEPRYSKLEPLKAGGKTLMAEGGAAGPFVFDWDGDGLQDLLVGCGSGRVLFCRNTGTKAEPVLAAGVTLVEPCKDDPDSTTHAEPTRSSQYAKVCAADWNGDGLPDLVVGDRELLRVDGSYKVHGWVWVYLRKAETVETSSTR